MSAKVQSLLAVEQRKHPTLSADFSWTFVGNAIYAGAQFAILMLLAKLVRPEVVGQYALGLAVVYPVMQFTNMQLRVVITSGRLPRAHFGHFLSLRFLTTSLALAIIFAIAQILGYGRELTAVVLMVGIAYAIETISDVYYARLQWHDRMAEISKSLMARAALSVLGLAVALYVSRNILWGVAGVVLARATILFGYDIQEQTHGLVVKSKRLFRHEELAPRFNLKLQRELVWLSLPLGGVVLLGCLSSSIPTFFIQHTLGERDVGIFAAIGFVVSVGNMAVVSLGQSAFTRLARSYATGNFALFGSLLGKLLAFGAMIGVCGIIISKMAGRATLALLFRPEYAQHADLLPWIMAAGGVLFMAQFLGFGLTAAGYYRSQVVLNLAANLTLFAACYWLVARRGLLGAILAMLIAAVVQLGGSLLILITAMRLQTHPYAQGAETA